MGGIESGFTNKYLSLSKNGLSKDDLAELKKDMVYGKTNDSKEINKLKNEILKDGRIDDNEAKLLVTVGFSLDEASAKTVRNHIVDPTNKYITTLFDKGQKAGKDAVNTYSTNHDVKAGIRDMGKSVLSTIDNIVGTSTASMVDNAEEAVKVNNKGAIAKLDVVLGSLKDSAQKSDCVKTALEYITKTNVVSSNSERVTEDFLNKATGKNWDAIELRNYNVEAGKNLLQGKKDQALVVVGAHTYVFKGLDAKGNLNVIDPSAGGKALNIDRNNPGMTVFVQGKGDGKASGDVRFMDKNAKSYDNFIKFYTNNKSTTINSSDKQDKTGESFEVRKLLLIMGDPDSKTVANKIFDLVGKKDLTNLKSALSSKGIKLTDQELKAFISVMNAPIKSEHGKSMLDEMKWLNDAGGKWTQNKTRYNVGMAYSDVNLADYFTKTKPEDMYKNFQDLLEGKQGC